MQSKSLQTRKERKGVRAIKEAEYCLFAREAHARSFLLHPHFLRQPRRLLDDPKGNENALFHRSFQRIRKPSYIIWCYATPLSLVWFRGGLHSGFSLGRQQV